MTDRSKRLLVVASDPDTRARVRESLDSVPLSVEEAASGREALARAEAEPPDLLIVDMILADMTGLGFARLVREHPALARLPILVISELTHEIDRILAFETGVDDVLAKPFFRRELSSRVGAILRRASGRRAAGASALLGPEPGLRFDPERGALEVLGRRVDLTPKEFDILAVLIRNAGRVLSRERIVGEVWGRRSGDPRVVDAHIKSIRRKLGEVGDSLQTVRGVGFRFNPRDSLAPDPEGGAGPAPRSGRQGSLPVAPRAPVVVPGS